MIQHDIVRVRWSLMIQRLKANWRILIVSHLIVFGFSCAWGREHPIFTSNEQVLGGVSAVRTRLHPLMEPVVNHNLLSCSINSEQEAFFKNDSYEGGVETSCQQ